MHAWNVLFHWEITTTQLKLLRDYVGKESLAKQNNRSIKNNKGVKTKKTIMLFKNKSCHDFIFISCNKLQTENLI